METKECPYCGEIIDISAGECPYCGEMIDSPARECPYCGEMIDSSATICPYCDEMLDVVSVGVLSSDVNAESADIVTNNEVPMEENVASDEEEKIVVDLENYPNKFLGYTLIVIGALLGIGNTFLWFIAMDEEDQFDKLTLGLSLENIMVPVALMVFYYKIKDTVAAPKFLKPMVVAIALHLWWLIAVLADIETSTFVDWVEYAVFVGSFGGMILAVSDYKPLSMIVDGLISYPVFFITTSILLDTDWVYDVIITAKHNNEIYLPYALQAISEVGIILFFRSFGDFFRGSDKGYSSLPLLAHFTRLIS